MSNIPVPEPEKEPPNGGSSAIPSTTTVPRFSIASSSDPIEVAPDKNQLAIDNKKLEILNFEHLSKRRAFYFVLIVSSLMFIVGTAMFCEVSRRMFGWQTLLVLLSFFTPATVILTVLIRAVFSSANEKKDESKKDESKKDDFGDLIPLGPTAKLMAELLKAAK